VRFVLDIENRVLVHVAHAAIERLRGAPSQQIGATGKIGVETFRLAIVQRKDVVLGALKQEYLLQLLQLLRVLLHEVACLRPVVRTIQLPNIVLEFRAATHDPGDAVPSAG